jgi:hypothetical protein
MASSNRGGPGSGSHSPGRGFVSVDPERQREIPHDPKGLPERVVVHPHQGVPGRPAGAARPAPRHDSDDEGGSGRRHRSS